ncbi:MAG: hypothetical protein D6820_17045, partial [Lentisphaerae bacterium]
HSALALGLRGDRRALPQLRQLATGPDAREMRTSRNNNHSIGEAALYLLGKLRDVEALPIFESHISRSSRGDDLEHFETVTQSLMALFRIGYAYPSQREAIGRFLGEVFTDADRRLILMLKSCVPGVRSQQPWDYTAYVRLLLKHVLRDWRVAADEDMLSAIEPLPVWLRHTRFNLEELKRTG